MKKIMSCRKLILAAAFLVGLTLLGVNVAASDEKTEYGEAYRNQLAYSAKEGWNNDPNGLIYVNETYHMYYQYNWNQQTSSTEMVWGNMSWGHATSKDLIHWEEQPVAIPAYQGQYNMMFSGSAVYDAKNSSGLFEMEDGTLKEGHGIVAILTQPADMQRQILAYSLDEGNSFQIYGEILSGNNEGSLGDDEFRDPKVFWSEAHNKWLMVVGGGAVRMYASTNLKDWEYLGQTGFWGECPDLSCYIVDGKLKYALVMSPEDKPNSHKFNQTSRDETFYPAEYYTVGELNEEGLFVASQPLKRLSEGLDSYAFQSFNNSPDGKVYGLSWSACWKNVDSYKDFRRTHNGGLTIACEMNLVEDSTGYTLTRKPVSQFEDLRQDKLFEYNDDLKKGVNALKDVTADIADLELEFDFTKSEANEIQLELRKSLAEKVRMTYNKETKEFVFDRTESSLLADNTPYYNWKNVIPNVDLKDGKLSLRIVLDRAFISVFIQGGEQSLFSAIFPSAISNGMSLRADADVALKASVWKMESIYGDVTAEDETIVTTHKLDLTVNQMKKVVTSSFAKDIHVDYSIREGADVVELYQDGNVAIVKGVKQGTAKILANDEVIDIYVYSSGLVSDVHYTSSLFGYSYETDKGLVLDYTGDAFLFSDQRVEDFTYSASLEVNEFGQAAGLLFGLSDNFHDYVVATVDFKDNVVKLWRAGVGDLKVAEYDFQGNKDCKLTIIVENKTVQVKINDEALPVLYYLLEDYTGGKLGLNVYNSSTTFNNIELTLKEEILFEGDKSVEINIEETIEKVVNVTDNSYRLTEADYTFENGVLKLSEKYLQTLKSDTEYIFRIVTSSSWIDKSIKLSFEEAQVVSEKTEFSNEDQVSFTIEGASEIKGVYVDGRLVNDYVLENNVLTLSNELVSSLVSGSHSVTVYTEKGRPSHDFKIVEVFANSTDETVKANHIFFFVDISIFAAVILGYVAFTLYKKNKKNKGGKKHE
ncbi:MAG: glycoside hydrolase family 32 protein [Anaeroplasmataceae bacterium]|nr:glycoside hydrolase family 32 protein [Anaeroplasmataceae bacterium]